MGFAGRAADGGRGQGRGVVGSDTAICLVLRSTFGANVPSSSGFTELRNDNLRIYELTCSVLFSVQTKGYIPCFGIYLYSLFYVIKKRM